MGEITIEVRSSGSANPGLDHVARAFEKATGIAVRIVYDDKIIKGSDDVFDVVLASRDALARDFLPTGRIENAAIGVGSIGLGVFIREGAPVPDISTMTAFAQTLDDADTLLLTTHTSGLYLESRLQKLGLFDLVARKIERHPNGPILMQRALQGSGRELGILSVAHIRQYADKGLVLVGVLPDALQYIREFAVAPMTASTHPEAARAFVRFCGGAGRKLLADSGFV